MWSWFMAGSIRAARSNQLLLPRCKGLLRCSSLRVGRSIAELLHLVLGTSPQLLKLGSTALLCSEGCSEAVSLKEKVGHRGMASESQHAKALRMPPATIKLSRIVVAATKGQTTQLVHRPTTDFQHLGIVVATFESLRRQLIYISQPLGITHEEISVEASGG